MSLAPPASAAVIDRSAYVPSTVTVTGRCGPRRAPVWTLHSVWRWHCLCWSGAITCESQLPRASGW